MEYDQLKLDNQLCFPVYAASRLITKLYQPFLTELGITYPQYLVLMVLWEKDNVSVKVISEKLLLESNTLTPLLKRMESNELITRERSSEDERSVFIKLRSKGVALKEKAASIPLTLLQKIESEEITLERLTLLKQEIDTLLKVLKEKW